MGWRTVHSKIPSYNILDIVKAISAESKIEIVGIRPGEKLHEEMITTTDSLNTIEFNDYYVILPSHKDWDVEEFINSSDKVNGKRCSEGFSYNSKNNTSFLSVSELRKLISTL